MSPKSRGQPWVHHLLQGRAGGHSVSFGGQQHGLGTASVTLELGVLSKAFSFCDSRSHNYKMETMLLTLESCVRFQERVDLIM